MSSSCQLKNGPWTPEEDEILAEHVQKYGEGNWNAVQKHSGLARCGKSCRLRWSNHLRPDLKRGSFSAEEQHKIIELHAKYGNKWSKMALELPGRTDNEIKNFWNTRRKKLDRLGLPLYPHGMTPSQPLNNNQETTLDVSSNQQADASQQTNIMEIPMLRFRKQHLLMSRKRKHLPRLPPIPEVSERSTSTASSEQDSDGTFALPVMQNPQKPLGDSNSSIPCSSSLCSTSPPALFDHDSHEFQGGDCFSGGYACLRGTSSISGAMVTDLPPFQQGSSSSCWDTPASSGLASFHESFDTLTQYKDINDDDDNNNNVLAPPDEGTQSELPPPVSPRSNGYMESILFPAKASNVEGGSEDDIANASCMHFCGGDHIEEYSDLRDPTNKDAQFGWFENDKNPYDGTLFAILQHDLRRYHCRRK